MAPSLDYNGGLTCSIGVSDLGKSIDWYRDRLGLELLYRVDEIGWCEFASHIDNVRVGLSQVENAGGRGGATLTIGVHDVEAARTVLEKQGVRFDGATQTIPDMVKFATFFDPDDNALMFYQDLPAK